MVGLKITFVGHNVVYFIMLRSHTRINVYIMTIVNNVCPYLNLLTLTDSIRQMSSEEG